MTRNQFWTLLVGAILVALSLLIQLVVAAKASGALQDANRVQAAIQEGRSCDVRMRQLATRIYQVAQQTQDQGLKDLLVRQQIVSNAPAAPNAAAPAANPAPVDH